MIIDVKYSHFRSKVDPYLSARTASKLILSIHMQNLQEQENERSRLSLRDRVL